MPKKKTKKLKTKKRYYKVKEPNSINTGNSFSIKWMSTYVSLFAAVGAVGLFFTFAAPTKDELAKNSSVDLVLLESSDNQAHYGQNVSFNMSTEAEVEPYVGLKCYVGGNLVLDQNAKYFNEQNLANKPTFKLASSGWSGEDAQCVAQLFYYDGGSQKALASTNFRVLP